MRLPRLNWCRFLPLKKYWSRWERRVLHLCPADLELRLLWLLCTGIGDHAALFPFLFTHCWAWLGSAVPGIQVSRAAGWSLSNPSSYRTEGSASFRYWDRSLHSYMTSHLPSEEVTLGDRPEMERNAILLNISDQKFLFCENTPVP